MGFSKTHMWQRTRTCRRLRAVMMVILATLCGPSPTLARRKLARLDGRAILVRFAITPITANSCHFEQAFSADGGRTWEVNWIADDTRDAGPAR